MEYLLSALIGYAFGSIPTAYILLKRKKNLDITKAGSGNVGAMNTYEVSKSKKLGAVVLIVDLLKGASAAIISLLIFSNIFIYPALSVLFAVFAHCFNPWINFNGGRGLATAAGGSAVIFPYLLIVWLILWAIFYIMRKDIHFANIGAIVMSVLLTFSTADIAVKYTYLKGVSSSNLIVITTAAMMIIFIKHINPLKELIEKQKEKGVSRNEF